MTRLSVFLATAMFFSVPANAEELSPGNWTSDCEDDFCVFRKTLTFSGQDSAFALFEILINVASGESSIVLTAPLGVALLLQKQSMDIRYIPFGRDNPISAVLPLNGLVAAISRTR